MTNIKVEYIRDGLVEEFHEGYCVQYSKPVDLPSNLYYLRSCAKPLQATLLVDYGAELEEDEIALCSGSHAGEEPHIEVTRRILKRYDLDETLLKCGVHAPLSRSMQDKMLLRGEKPTPIHNNCSGKHIGFLVLCKIKGWDLDTYDLPEHPLQIAIKNKINELAEVKEEYPMTTDGCGVPILSMPLYNMLTAYKNLLNYDKIVNSILKYPYIFGGENRLDTEIIRQTEGIIAKVGAGGLCVVMNIKKQDGFAVKINDCSMEARKLAVFEIINKLGWGDIKYDNKIYTLQNKIVGKIKVSIDL